MISVSGGEVEFTDRGVTAMLAVESMRRREWTAEWFGVRCPDFEATCIVCQAWQNQDAFEELIR